jgi:hypothetical protein
MENQKQPQMTNKLTKGKPDPARAVFRLVVFFKKKDEHGEQIKRVFYNYRTCWNAELHKVIECEKTALQKLERLVMHKWKGQYITALIIHQATGTIVKKYVYDSERPQLVNYSWAWENEGIRFKLNKTAA